MNDYFQYWFMLPTSVLIATCAVSFGIGGAAIFGPLFLIIFPLLGHRYLLPADSTVTLAILIETFGFMSGLIGYYRRQLIDFQTARKAICITVPAAVASSMLLIYIVPVIALKFFYSFIMIGTGLSFLYTRAMELKFAQRGDSNANSSANNCTKGRTDDSNESMSSHPSHRYSSVTEVGFELTSETDSAALVLAGSASSSETRSDQFLSTPPSNESPLPISALVVSLLICGGSLTGLLGVGVGEIFLPYLARTWTSFPRCAATSTAVVTMTCAATVVVQISTMAVRNGSSGIPWNVAIFAVPGVIIGAQVAVFLQDKVTRKTKEFVLGLVFFSIGIAFLSMSIMIS